MITQGLPLIIKNNENMKKIASLILLVVLISSCTDSMIKLIESKLGIYPSVSQRKKQKRLTADDIYDRAPKPKDFKKSCIPDGRSNKFYCENDTKLCIRDRGDIICYVEKEETVLARQEEAREEERKRIEANRNKKAPIKGMGEGWDCRAGRYTGRRNTSRMTHEWECADKIKVCYKYRDGKVECFKHSDT